MPALSFRSALILRISGVIAVTMAVVGTFTYVQVLGTARDQASKVMRQTSSLVRLQVATLLGKVEDQAKFVARNRALDQQELAKSIVETLKVNPELSEVSVVFASDGSGVAVAQKSNGELGIKFHSLVKAKEWKSEDWAPFGEGIRSTGNSTIEKADPRLRPGYLAAMRTKGSGWIEDSEGEPGYSFNFPMIDPSGTMVGAVRAKVSVVGLSKFIQQLEVGRTGNVVIMDASQRIIAYPDPGRMTIQRNGATAIADAKDIASPAVLKFLERIEELQLDLGVTAQPFTVQSDKPFIGSVQRLAIDGKPNWLIGILVPEDEFTSGSRQVALFFLTFIILALGVGVLVSIVMARRVSSPLAALAREAEGIQNLNLNSNPIRTTKIREIDDLARSMEQMKTSLRSLQKLVPAEYARYLIQSGQEAKLGGERRQISTFFGDIIGFTSLSHELAPEELMSVLTEYLHVLSEQVMNHGGTIDKFNGDDVMAFWGAPTAIKNHAELACRCALASMNAIDQLHTELRDHGRPLLRASFGIATGDVIVGNVGNYARMNYTVIGDSVNLASRLQGVNKFYQSNILICKETLDQAGNAIVARWVDRVVLSGRDTDEDIYELLSLRESANERQLALETWHNQAKECFAMRKWDEAEEALLLSLAADAEDAPASILLDRIRKLRQSELADTSNRIKEK